MKPDLATEIVSKLRASGHEAYFVGGCVRDMVLGLEPVDYDIATSAHPETVVQLFPRTETVGAKFGVVLVIYRGHPFEVATFRSDKAYVDGRRPTGVVYTDAQQDVLRRDFTINGLLYDPLSRNIIDYVHGRADIEARLVRAIGDPRQRFEEDKLRILRGVRFGARLGYRIEPATWAAVCEMAPAIHQVSRERIREELVRILTEGDAAHGIELLEQSGLRREILPEVVYSAALRHELSMLRRDHSPDFAMAVLLHEAALLEVASIMERLKFSRSEMQHVFALTENLPKFSQVRKMRTAELKRFMRLPRFHDHLELARIHAVAHDQDLQDYECVSEKYVSWTTDEIAPQLLISGEDLKAMGFAPGPLFKTILTRVENDQLEGRITSREQALNFVRDKYGDGGTRA
jgi:poly(A) polymerase